MRKLEISFMIHTNNYIPYELTDYNSLEDYYYYCGSNTSFKCNIIIVVFDTIKNKYIHDHDTLSHKENDIPAEISNYLKEECIKNNP